MQGETGSAGLLACPVLKADPSSTGAADMHLLAYLDPGSGSMILQIIAGGAAAVAVTAKLYWNRILKFLRIRKDDETPEPQQQTEA
jgi:hypothetical protein